MLSSYATVNAPAPRPLFVAEPPAHHLVRPPAVVDCSVLCALLCQEPEAAQAGQRLIGRELHAPRLLDAEVPNVAVKKVRRGLAPAEAERAMADDLDPPPTLVDPQPEERRALALRYSLSGHDVAYLWLAAALRAPLLTFDKNLGLPPWPTSRHCTESRDGRPQHDDSRTPHQL